MEACIFFAKRADWKASPELLKLVTAAFKGLRQTKMNEDANQQVRDFETRNALNKMRRHFGVWHVPVSGKLLEKYQWQEVSLDPSLPTLQPEPTLFKRTAEACSCVAVLLCFVMSSSLRHVFSLCQSLSCGNPSVPVGIVLLLRSLT